MGKADEAANGCRISEAELQDASRVPPAALSAEQKSPLVGRIKRAEQVTQTEEQAMLNGMGWDFSDAPAATGRFNQPKRPNDEVSEDLSIGQQVHWDRVRQALQVVQCLSRGVVS